MYEGKAGQHEVYQRPELKGPDEVHIQGLSGKTTIRNLQTLDKLQREGKISGKLFSAGELYLGIVERFYAQTSPFASLSDEAPNAGGNTDPIRLYTKGRRSYRSTQRPRNVVRPRSSFDGWTSARSDALKAMHRLRTAIKYIDGEALRALYALVIHPSDPHRLPTTLRAYTIHRYGYRDSRLEARVVQSLVDALSQLHEEYGERFEEAA